MAKIRMDFVTNSSSSSYVIAFRNPKSELIAEEELNRLSPVVKNIIKSVLVAYSNILNKADYNVTSKKEFDENFINQYGYQGVDTVEQILEEEGEWIQSYYKKGIDFLEKGYTITGFTVDYDDESMSELLDNICDGENIIMVERD